MYTEDNLGAYTLYGYTIVRLIYNMWLTLRMRVSQTQILWNFWCGSANFFLKPSVRSIIRFTMYSICLYLPSFMTTMIHNDLVERYSTLHVIWIDLCICDQACRRRRRYWCVHTSGSCYDHPTMYTYTRYMFWLLYWSLSIMIRCN